MQQSEESLYTVETQSINNSGCWETDNIEEMSRHHFEIAEISTNDVGGEPGQPFRLRMVDPDNDYEVLATREIESY